VNRKTDGQGGPRAGHGRAYRGDDPNQVNRPHGIARNQKNSPTARTRAEGLFQHGTGYHTGALCNCIARGRGSGAH
jgi:hypothetical protein